MSRFHREILEDYGLFMISSDKVELTSALHRYIRPSVTSMKAVTAEDHRADGSRYLIVDPDPVKDQILSYMRSGGADLLLGKDKEDAASMGYHDLNHGPTVVSLPSRQIPDMDLVDLIGKKDVLKDIKGVFTEGSEKFLLGSYVTGTFNNCTGIADRDHFFHNEVEYILCGRLTDEENEKAIIRTLRTLRLPSNLAHIYLDRDKMAALTATAEAIAPGPLGLAVQAALAGAWAFAESSNDAALLLEGKKVPLVKDDASWAMDVDALLSSLRNGALDPDRFESTEGSVPHGDDPEKLLKKDRRVIYPSENKGLDYEKHLRILLFLKDDPQTVMRILDLIQINVRKDHDGTFLIGEQSTGISYGLKINGRDLDYDRLY